MLLKDHLAVMSAIERKLMNNSCPMCAFHSGFTVNINEFQENSHDRVKNNIQIEGVGWCIPCALIVCKHCGYIMKFSLDDLLDDPGYSMR